MSRVRSILVLSAALITAVPGVAAAGVATASPPSRAAVPAAPGVEREYVVAYTGGTATATAAITASGGVVEDVNEHLQIAKVSSTSDGFLTAVRARPGIAGATPNASVGMVRPDMPHREVEERPVAGAPAVPGAARKAAAAGEPLADRQWDMTMIGADAAHRKATGKGVDVGIIDTGIDGSHPDLAPHFDAARSQNFTTDIPLIDGPCEYAGCVDPPNVDDGGHGTHVAGTVAAATNGVGIGGVAPDATLINLRAGQDSGYFFLYETVSAITAAGVMKLDVVNMSFYTDPWLFNCATAADYVSGAVTGEEIAQQALTRQLVLKATAFASRAGVTLVAAAGNGHTNFAAPTRSDAASPDYDDPTTPAVELPTPRVVTDNCLSLPAEAPEVISVSSVGPSKVKSDFSDYGFGDVEVAAPGGWFRDGFGTPAFQTYPNMILSSYPLDVAVEEGLADANGQPTDGRSAVSCDAAGDSCGFYTYLQGTSMAAPHAAGVAALIIERYGNRTKGGGKSLAPATVRWILENTATDVACPAGGVQSYVREGRDSSWDAVCDGTTSDNGLYGEGLINAAKAVGVRR